MGKCLQSRDKDCRVADIKTRMRPDDCLRSMATGQQGKPVSVLSSQENVEKQ
jgi:hypothetical protein